VSGGRQSTAHYPGRELDLTGKSDHVSVFVLSQGVTIGASRVKP